MIRLFGKSSRRSLYHGVLVRQWVGDYFLKNLGEIVLPNSHFLSDCPLIVQNSFFSSLKRNSQTPVTAKGKVTPKWTWN